MFDGPPDAEGVVARAARVAEMPAEQRLAGLDEPAVHEAHRQPIRHLLTALLERRHNRMQATDSGLLQSRVPLQSAWW